MPSRVRLLVRLVLSGLLRTGDLIIDCIDIGIFNDGVKRFEYTVAKKSGADAIGEVVQRFKGTVKLSLTVIVGVIGTEHANENLLEESGLTIGGNHILTQIARLDMKARELGAVADDLEITAVDKFAILRAAYDSDEIVVGKLTQKRDIDTEDVGNVLDGVQFLARLLRRNLHGGICQETDLERERGQVRGAIELLLDSGKGHVPRLLKMQDDLKAVNVGLRVLTIALRGTMGRNKPLVLKEAYF